VTYQGYDINLWLIEKKFLHTATLNCYKCVYTRILCKATWNPRYTTNAMVEKLFIVGIIYVWETQHTSQCLCGSCVFCFLPCLVIFREHGNRKREMLILVEGQVHVALWLHDSLFMTGKMEWRRERKNVCARMREGERGIMNHSLRKPFKNQSYLSDSLPSPAFFSHYQNIKTFCFQNQTENSYIGL